MLRIPKGSSSKDLSLGQTLNGLEIVDPQTDLKQFRDTMWEKARNLDPWELLPQSFLKLIQETQPSRVGIFIPKKGWAEASNLVEVAQSSLDAISQKNIQLLGPQLNGDDLSFHTFNPTHIQIDAQKTLHIASPTASIEPDLLLIPALACDVHGQRIGRGKGYYDRYLSTRPELTRCAVIHSSFLFGELPGRFFHSGDQKVHYVLTEKSLIKITNGNEVHL